MDHIRVIPETPRHPPAYHGRPWYYPESMKHCYSRTSSNGGARPIPYVCPSPRRSRTAASFETSDARRDRDQEPWRHMAKTYAWVMEQEIEEMARQNEETVRWVLKQQERDIRERAKLVVRQAEGRYWDLMEEIHEVVDEEIHHHLPRQDRYWTRQSSFQEELDMALQEELRKFQSRRRETERCRAAYERRKALEEHREKERRKQKQDKMKVERDEAERTAWKSYEAKWSTLASGDEAADPLTFETVPWPLITPPRSVEDLRPARIAMFLLSPQHSEEQTRKDRIRNALRRWHPDRFGRILAKVRDEDKEKVAEGAGIVARCLNNLLERSG